MSSNNNAIEKCKENLKTMVAEESLEIKQAQQVVLREVISSKADVKESGDNMLEQICILNNNQADMSGTLKELGIINLIKCPLSNVLYKFLN